MKNSLVVHPFLFALFPVLFLLASNTELLSVNNSVLEIAIVSLVVTFLYLMLLKFVLKDAQKAGLIVSISLLLFFSYVTYYFCCHFN